MTKLLFILFLLLPNSLLAGTYVDFGLGTHINKWENGPVNPFIGKESPLGLFRIGYEYKYIRAYWEHLSSIPNTHDKGANILMIDVHIKLEDLFK